MKKLFLVALLVLGALALLGKRAPSGLRTPAPTATAKLVSAVAPAAGPAGAQSAPAAQATASITATGATAASPTAAGVSAPDRRAWDYDFLDRLHQATTGDAIRFELTGGEFASGTIGYLEHQSGQVIVVAGEVTAPEAGRFSFRRQTLPGKAGDYSGEVIFPGSRRAFRIEPSGPGGKSELVARRLDEVLCLTMPPVDPALLSTNETEEMPPLDVQDVPDYVPAYNGGIVSLQSLPGSKAVIYLDYRGGYTPTWGGITYAKPNVSNAQIRDLWKRVVEDYIPFGINVTTDIRVYEAAAQNSRQRCVLTPTTTAAPGAGGVAFVGDWNNTGDRPCWAFYTSGKSGAEVVAHEVGHTLGLSHDGRTSPYNEGYYGGQGSGAVGWAPIMGVGYYKPVAQWSKGEYAYANQTQNDLNIIVSNNNNVDYRADDTGATLATARYLELYTNGTAFAEGVIETTGDTDAFRFSTTGGAISLTASPVGDWADLAVMATLADATDTIIASNNPQTTLSATIATTLPAGTYTFRVTGAGRNDPLTDGFSAYASLGYYSVSGSVANGVLPSRFSVAETATNGTVVGTILPPIQGGDPLAYAIVSGNTSSAFALDNNGVLKVANAAALNYETLAAKTVFTVQYELFVNITNTVDPDLTELNRRVVVQVLDVNEPPVISGLTNTVLAHTKAGTVLGTVSASDPDFYSVLTLSILAGNSNNMFALDSASGALTVAGDLNAASQSLYTLTVQAKDNGAPKLAATNTVRLSVVNNSTPFQPGSLSYAVYDGIGSGVYVSNLTTNPRFPADPTWEKQVANAEGDASRGDSYGSVLRGYLIPPLSGSYTFYIASDDNSELWLSTSTNVAAAGLIASVNGASSWTDSRQWNKFASQKSTVRSLVAGQGYYLEARHKEGSGGDNLAVGWSGPATGNQTNVISGLYLAPRFINYVPHLTGFTNNAVRRGTVAGARLGSLNVTDANPGDTHSFAILSGNAAGLFSVDQDGWVRVADASALQNSAASQFTLSIRATDNGAPPLSTTGTVALTLINADTLVPTVLQRELFYYIGSGTAISDLTGNAKYPNRPDALSALPSGNFATPEDIADSYGSRIRGYLVPPVSGDYRFFIAGDDSAQLKFCAGTNPAAATVIASTTAWTGASEWTKYASQTSAVQTGLVAGQLYYIETLQKEGSGGDHVSVGWVVPGSGITNVIPAASLLPLDLNAAPQFNSQTLTLLQGVRNGEVFGTVAAADSPLDDLTFTIVSGNTNNTFAIDPDSGALAVADNSLIASGALTRFSLTVLAQDSGLGGLYPLKSAQAAVTVVVTNAPAATQPDPALGEFNVELDRTLAWSGVSGVLHDVYFGASAAAVAAATPASPEYKGRQSALTFDPGPLAPAVTYYWRVDEISGAFITKGAVWRFSTAESALDGRLLVHLTFDNADLSGSTLNNTLDSAPWPDRFAISNAVTGQPGLAGEAFYFNGSSAAVRSFSNSIIPAGTPGATFSAWVKTASSTGGEHVISVEGAWVLRYDAGSLVAFFDGSSVGNPVLGSGLNDNHWHHIAAANDGTATMVYVDGQLIGAYDENLFDLGTLTRQVSVGASYDLSGSFYSGAMDEVAIWGRALSAEEVAQIYTNGLAGKAFEPLTLLTRTSFEPAEGFSGYPTNVYTALGSKTAADGSVWSGLGGEVQIWYRSDIPPKGQQCLKLGDSTADALCRVQIPGTNHGAGIVMFDWASFSSSSSGTVSLSWSNKFSGGWVPVWSNTLSGLNPDWAAKPWPAVAVPINAVGDVDLLFKRVGNKGVLIDNVRLTGKPNSNAPFFLASPALDTNALCGVAFAGSLAGCASDVDAGDALVFSKTAGPAWLSVAPGGALSGTPLPADAGLNEFTVRATDSLGAWSESLVRLAVTNPAPPAAPVLAASLSGSTLLLPVASQPGYTYVLQAASDLSAPVAWSNVATNAGTGGVLNFSAPVDAAQPRCYYRVLAY